MQCFLMNASSSQSQTLRNDFANWELLKPPSCLFSPPESVACYKILRRLVLLEIHIDEIPCRNTFKMWPTMWPRERRHLPPKVVVSMPPCQIQANSEEEPTRRLCHPPCWPVSCHSNKVSTILKLWLLLPRRLASAHVLPCCI